MTGIFNRKALDPATQHRTNACGSLVSFGRAISPCTIANLEVIEADPISRALGHMRAAKAPPCLVHRDDAPSGIEQSDMRRQRVEDDCLIGGSDVAQLFLGASQQKGSAVTVHHRIQL